MTSDMQSRVVMRFLTGASISYEKLYDDLFAAWDYARKRNRKQADQILRRVKQQARSPELRDFRNAVDDAILADDHKFNDAMSEAVDAIDEFRTSSGAWPKTAADDPKKLLQKGMDDPGLKHVKRAWDDFTKGVAEAQRQYNSVGGAHPTSVLNDLVSKFIHRPLKDLGEEATAWAKRIGKGTKTADAKVAKGWEWSPESNILMHIADHRRTNVTIVESSGRSDYDSSERKAIGRLLRGGFLDRYEIESGGGEGWGVSLTRKGRQRADNIQDERDRN